MTLPPINYLIGLLVLATTTTADVAWVKWSHHNNARRAIPAGLWSMGIACLGVFGTINLVNHPVYAPAAIIGAGLGTVIGVDRAA